MHSNSNIKQSQSQSPSSAIMTSIPTTIPLSNDNDILRNRTDSTNSTSSSISNNLMIHEAIRKRTDFAGSKNPNYNSHNIDLNILEDGEEKIDSSRIRVMINRMRRRCSTSLCNSSSQGEKKLRIVLSLMLMGWIYYYYCPEDIKKKPELWLRNFLSWVQYHPTLGMMAYVAVYALHVVILLPATPLTLGGGYVFKAMYGWYGGIVLGSLVSLLGSLLGSVSCFLLARYCIREQVRTFLRRSKHASLFDAVDTAITVQGFRIVALLYLTPVLPLGVFSYMVGTTSLELFPFAAAKIFALPLTSLYIVMGASTGTLVSSKKNENVNAANIITENKENVYHVLLGMIISIISLSIISLRMKKELQRILEKTGAKKDKNDSTTLSTTHNVEIPFGTERVYSKSSDSSTCNGTTGVSPQTNNNNSLTLPPVCCNDHSSNVWRRSHRD
jgi:uncharacterized membrane protein YdjX (TVP38/TMEM64 family)